MSYPTVFANLAGGTQPASLLDTMFNICGNQGNIACTAAGTNAITLTPNTNFFNPAAYVSFQMVTFQAVATSTSAVTIQISALGFVKLFTVTGVQAGSGDIVSGDTYVAIFNQAFDAGNGGFQVISAFGNLFNFDQGVPGGYLTTATGVPIQTAANTTITSGNPIFYTPYRSNLVPVWNGAQWLPQHFSELQLVLDTTMLAGNIYDVFLFNNAGTLTLGTGPSWTAGGGSVTAGSCARGTGAGSTQLQRTGSFGGVFLNNAVSITARNGVNNFAVAAGFGTYLGSIFIDTGAAGQVSCQRGSGQSLRWGIWNYYNRVAIQCNMSPGGTWTTVANFTWRPSNNDANNVITVFSGFAEEIVEVSFSQVFTNTTSAVAAQSNTGTGIGLNSTTAPLFHAPIIQTLIPGATAVAGCFARAEQPIRVPLGINNVTALEQVQNIGANTTVSFSGTSANYVMTARWRG